MRSSLLSISLISALDSCASIPCTQLPDDVDDNADTDESIATSSADSRLVTLRCCQDCHSVSLDPSRNSLLIDISQSGASSSIPPSEEGASILESAPMESKVVSNWPSLFCLCSAFTWLLFHHGLSAKEDWSEAPPSASDSWKYATFVPASFTDA